MKSNRKRKIHRNKNNQKRKKKEKNNFKLNKNRKEHVKEILIKFIFRQTSHHKYNIVVSLALSFTLSPYFHPLSLQIEHRALVIAKRNRCVHTDKVQ